MHSSLPAGIVVVETFDDVRYELPRRELGPIRCRIDDPIGSGLLVLAIGFAAAGIAVSLKGWMGHAKLSITGFFAITGITMSLSGLFMILAGAYLRFGRDAVELSEGGLRAIFRFGPIRWSRRVDWSRIARFVVVPVEDHRAHATTKAIAPTDYLLQAVLVRGVPVQIAYKYHHDLLLSLANELSRRGLGLAVVWDLAPGSMPAALKVVEEDPKGLIRDRASQPTDSTAVLERFADGVTIAIPPDGFRRCRRLPFFIFCLFWMGMHAIVFVAALFGKVKNFPPDSPVEILFFVFDFLITIGFLLAMIHMVRRQSVLSARGGTLAIRESGPFGSRVREWPVEALAGVRAEGQVQDVEGSPVWTYTLAIEPVEGESFTLLSHREKSELEWIATTLRETMNLPAPEPKDESW